MAKKAEKAEKTKEIKPKAKKISKKEAAAALLTAKLEAEIPRILALKKMGLKPEDIAKQLNVSKSTLKRFCRERPELQDICACRAYREEYVMAQLFTAFCRGELSEKGSLKLLDILLRAGLLEIRKQLLEIEADLKKNGTLSQDMSLTVSGISDADLTEVMHSLTRRGRREASDYDDRVGVSDFKDKDEIIDTHIIGNG